MSSLQEHIERVMRRSPRGIEPEFYMEAPEPPAPVENSGIGRDYIQPDRLLLNFVFGCTECGALVHDTGVHEGWHEGRAA